MPSHTVGAQPAEPGRAESLAAPGRALPVNNLPAHALRLIVTDDIVTDDATASLTIWQGEHDANEVRHRHPCAQRKG